MDKPPCICGCDHQWHVPGGGSCTKCRSRCFGYVEESKMNDFADHTFERDESPEGHCQICGDPQNLHEQGFTVNPTGMMEQVVDPLAAEQEAESTEEKTPMGRISICRMVEYRSRTGNYSVPAVVNCTTDSIYQPGVEAGFVPPLSSPAHVHLTVFSPGRTGMRIDAGNDKAVFESFVSKPTHGFPISENVAGCYQEWDIPYDAGGRPGTWRWPTRV